MSKKSDSAGLIIVDKPYFLVVDMGDGAQMTCPTSELDHMLRYGGTQNIGSVAASAVESFNYLVMNCTKEEAWRRILIMRKAMKDQALSANTQAEE